MLDRHFFLNYLLFLFLNLVILSTKADFGSSCVPLPTITNNNYLFSNSAYGHIISNIDMTSYIENACDPSSTQLSFCVKNSPQNTQICTKVTMNLGEVRPLSSLNNNPDLGGNNLLKDIVLSVNKLGSNMCLMMPTSRGMLPVACKKSTTVAQSVTPTTPKCNNISDICYGKNTKSQSILNFTGDAVNCLVQTLDLVFYQQNVCASDPNDPNTNSVASTLLSPFPSFQASMQNAVRAALIIYVIFFGFKIVMNNEYADLNNIATFLMKFILVAYFAVGLMPSFNQGKLATKNGVTEFMLPFLTGATANFAQIIFKAGGSSGLCSFDINKYQAGYSGYAIWDSIDCRAGYYLGLQLLYNNGDVLKNINSNSKSNSSSNNPGGNNLIGNYGVNSLNLVGGMPFFSVLFGFLMGSNIVIVIAGILFAIIFISLLLQFISTYLVCLVTIYVMAYISPIFVTMALFKQTKPYFDSWLRIIISCALQPAVLAGFMAILLTTYDTAIFNDCEFIRHDYELGDNNFSTFELKANSSSCKDSAGYKLLRYYNGEGWTEKSVILFSIKYLIDVFQLVTNLLYVGAFTFIFYFFSKSISQFASDLTGGPGMSAVTASPTKVIEQAKKFAAMAASSGGGIGGFARAGMKSAGEIGDKGKNNEKGIEGGEAKDSIASGDAAEGGGMGGGGDGGAKDMIGK